jgi:cytochrome c-type biogenesis protein CcmH/NrfG
MKEQGEQFLEEALRYEPDDAESCQRLATLYYERGAYVEAGACLENLLRLSPERHDLVPQIMALYQRQIALVGTSQ